MSMQDEPLRDARDASARTELDLDDVRRLFAPKFFPHSDPVVQQIVSRRIW